MGKEWIGSPRLESHGEALTLDLKDRSPSYVEVSDTGIADEIVTVRHGLGRTPIGLNVIRLQLQQNSLNVAPSGPHVLWYQRIGDRWNDRVIDIRFRVFNARVLLEIK